MRVYIDCEFNGFGGHLMTMALVAADGKEFYVDVDSSEDYLCDFVRKHVVPVIDVPGATPEAIPYNMLPYAISEFLGQYDLVHLIADWPDDIKYFCEALITSPGERVDTPELIMQIIREDGKSEVPHNALHDARAIMKVHQEVYFSNDTGENMNV